jgi:putative NIF3 family GTP cyclohydrolase 1 type 2
MQKSRKATHAAVSRFIASVLPLKENDVPRLYHVPRNPRYDPETAVVEHVVLSVTATPGVYSLIGYPHDEASIDADAPVLITLRRPPRTLCFLHRPFDLDRRSVRTGTLVLSSHTSFDEVLTVGWNPSLAERLGFDVNASLCVQGYKGKGGWDPDRRIGIIGQVSQHRDLLVRRIEQEFGPVELAREGLSDEIHVVAIMNAFNQEQVHRVTEMAQQAGWIPPDDDGRHMLYLTGQPRVAGLEAAQALGISVACVGHRQAEDWGIRYMAVQLRTAFPGVSVEEVYEEEVPVIREKKVRVVGEPPADALVPANESL